MKRDQSISLTYLPPRVREVEVFSDQRILVNSKEATFRIYVDEIESVDPETEKSCLFLFPPAARRMNLEETLFSMAKTP